MQQRCHGSLFALSALSPFPGVDVTSCLSHRWSYGANRVLIDADIKLLSEFLSYLQADSVRGFPAISSLASGQSHKANRTYKSRMHGVMTTYMLIDYTSILKNLNVPLRLLVDNELVRLTVWTNPANEAKRGTDHFGTIEKTMTDVGAFVVLLKTPIHTGVSQTTWTNTVRKLWQIDPAVAIYLTERFNVPIIAHEVGRLVRSRTRDVLDIPEALRFLVGDKTGADVRRDLKVERLIIIVEARAD